MAGGEGAPVCPLIVLCSPSTRSASSSDSYSNRVYKSTIIDEEDNYYVNDEEDCEFVNIDTMDECDERFDEDHRTHSRGHVCACEMCQ